MLSILSDTLLFSSNTRRVEETVQGLDRMLKEIYTWFIRNLKHSRAQGHPTTDQAANEASPLMELTFELHTEASGGVSSDVELICPTASLHRHWALGARENTNNVQSDGGKLFICRCGPGRTQTERIHQDRLAGIRCELLVSLNQSCFIPHSCLVGNITTYLKYLLCIHYPESDFARHRHR